MAFIILIVEPSSAAIESSNALRITFRRGCPALEIGLKADGVGDLWRFWVSRLSERPIVATQGSLKHSAAVGRSSGLSCIIRAMRRSTGSLLTRTVFPRSSDFRE